MLQMLKISLVTITRNNADGLGRTLRSVSSQTYGDIEHIVVDGHSTDGTGALLDGLRDGCKILDCAPRGIYNAINAGMAAAMGDVVGLLHAGDVFASDDILQQVAAAFEDKGTDYIYGDVHFARPGGRVTRYYSGAGLGMAQLRRGTAPPHPSLYMRRGVAQRVGPYCEDFRTAADFEMFVRLFGDSTLTGRYLPWDMVAMAPGGASATLRSRLVTNNTERLRALRQNGVASNPVLLMLNYLRAAKGLIKLKR